MPTAANSTAARLGRLEAEVEGIKGEVHGIRRAIETLAGEMRATSKPQWGTLIAAGGFIVLLVGALVALGSRAPLDTLQDLKLEVVRQHETDISAAAGRGQALAVQDQIQARLEILEDYVQAMRGNRFTNADGKALDSRLDGEVKRVWDYLNAHTADGHPEALRGRLERIEGHLDGVLDRMTGR